MSWNHRVVKDHNGFFTIREVFYEPTGQTVDPIAPCGETVDELRGELVLMLMATYKDVIEEDEQPTNQRSEL